MIDAEVEQHYNQLLKKVNSVKDFSSMLPDDALNDSILLNFILYFVEPSFQGLELCTTMNGIFLTDDEKEAIYPPIIDFIDLLKDKFMIR